MSERMSASNRGVSRDLLVSIYRLVNLNDELELTPTGRRVEVGTAKGALELEETYLQLSSDGVNVLTLCLVSDELSSVLVGVITLEQLSLKVNPLTGKLEKHRTLLF